MSIHSTAWSEGGTLIVTMLELGQYSALESPLKSGLQTPDRPAFFGHGDSKPLPAMPPHVQRNAGVWAPRTPTSIADFSSGGETPRTPNQNADSDATPDASLRTKMSKMWNDTKRDGRTSPKKPGRRDSWLSFLAPSTSAKPEASRRELGASKADGRVVKRRGKQAKQLARKDDGYGSSEDGHKSKRSRKGGQRNRKDERDETPSGPTTPVEPAKSSIETFFAFIVRHPTLPHVLSFYAQLVLNLFLVFSAIYVLYWFGTAIFDEVSMQAKKTQSEVLVEIATCEMHFRDNRCDRATRVPAMESACSNWEACMKRDPSRVARASVTMKTFAIIFNSFVEEFSYKSMVCPSASVLKQAPANIALPLSARCSRSVQTDAHRSSSPPSSSSAASTCPTGRLASSAPTRSGRSRTRTRRRRRRRSGTPATASTSSPGTPRPTAP